MVKGILYRLLPTPARIQGPRQYATNLFLDAGDFLLNRTRSDEPPRRLNISGTGSFRELGDHNVFLCREYGNLRATDRVLDIGCGIGRTALALARFLEPPGSYVGLDTVPFALRWCRRNITSKHPNFEFIHADIFNRMYNPRGTLSPDTYSFPFAEASFTFCIATSLFTHLLPGAVEQYINEAARVLRPGGTFLSTFFLLCPETSAPRKAGSSQFDFQHRFERHAQRSLHAPEQAIAYDLDYVRELYANAGLEISGIHFGGWSGCKQSINSGQDLIIGTRT
jgi:SAM-dependent methyltransferase